MSGGLEDFDVGPVAAELRDMVDAFLAERPLAPTARDNSIETLVADLAHFPGDEPGNITDIMGLVTRTLEPGFDTAGPGFLSYIPTGALPVAALAAYVAATTNRFTGANHAAPGAVAMEQSVIDWMIDLFGLPESAGGVLFSGGSIANLTATVAARSQLGEDFSNGVVYASELAHHSVAKAARIAGIAADRVRAIATDSMLRIDCAALERHLADDLNDGLQPMMVIATAGTTDTGAIDPLPDCSALAQRFNCWFHVDAAYGGFFQLTERGRNLLRGIDRADSITVDAHKSLFLPFGIGGLLVRDTRALIEAHEGRGAYLQDVTDASLPQFYEMGPELTRPNRGLQMWLPLHVHGVNAFRVDLDRMLDLADQVVAQLHAIPGITVTTEDSLSIVTFAADAGDQATRQVLDGLNSSGEVHVSSTTLAGRVVIRAAFLSQRTTQAVADRLVDLVRQTVAEVR